MAVPKTKLVIKNGYLATGASTITGSLIVTTGVTGSLLGTASNATLADNSTNLGGLSAASYALGTSITGFATTGSNTFIGNQSVAGNVTVTGTLTANTYIVSSSLTNLTIAYASGSTAFGNSSDDTHTFTGSLSILGSINTGTGGITGSFKGDGTGLTGVTATAIFPTTAKTDLASSDQFYINDGANKYVTYGNLLTDLAGSNLVVEGTDSLALNTTITGLTSVSSSILIASSHVNIGAVAKTFAGSISLNPGTNNIISVDPNTDPHNAIHVKYVLYNTGASAYSNMRAGTIMIVRDASGANSNIAESTTQDIGDTSTIDFTVSISGTTDIVMDSSAQADTIVVKFEYTLL